MKKDEKRSRILIIGLDGGTFDLIKPWVNEGKLPAIAKLLKKGSHGYLRSTIPPMTFPAWNAFMTGKNPGKHGVFDFTERKPGTYELDVMNAGNRKSETIWKIASNYGKRCVVIGVPVTYPPEKINGIMISGFDAPFLDERIIYPRELFYELKEKVGEYIVSASFSKYLKTGHVDKALEAMCLAIDRKADTAKYILKREAWDLFMIVFGETDAAIHHFWKYHDKNSPQRNKEQRSDLGFDPIFEIYDRVDKHIGELLEMAPEESTVIIMSDHGAGGVSNKTIYLNRFLEIHGLLKFKSLPIMINKGLDTLKASIRFMLPEKLVKHLLFNPRNIGLKLEAKLRFSYIDWAKTKVYAEETPHYPSVRINLKKREPDGIVEEGAYKNIVNETISLLQKWIDPETGKRIVRKAYSKEDLYHGDYLGKAPDIIIAWNDDNGYSYLSRPSFVSRGKVSIETMSSKEIENSDFMFNRSGSHRDKGIFIITGKQIEESSEIEGVTIVDLAPTILYLLDIPIPRDMDGKVPLHCFKKDYLRVPVFQDLIPSETKGEYCYRDEEKEEIKRRLKDLGYL